jgi:3-oxoacyl-[acyl-carrier protein] reductase
VSAVDRSSARRVALITGASGKEGIAAAIARRLAPTHDLMLTGFTDASSVGDDTPWLDEPRELGARVEYLTADLAEAPAPGVIVEAAIERFGGLDTLIAAHAHSSATPLGSLVAEEIDKHLIVNVRGTLLLVEAFAQAHDPEQAQGRIVLFSSGQRLGPMPGELAYVASKGGLEALVLSLTDVLARAGITINALNPGPTDTGWLAREDYEAVRARFPAGRWGTPDDAARAVAWLTSDDGRWVTGQVLDSEGGFRRSAHH